MSPHEPSPLHRLFGRLFLDDWQGANEVVSEHLPEYWHDFVDAWRLEHTQNPEAAARKYSALRQDLEQMLIDDEDDEDAKLLKPIVESRGIALAINEEFHPPGAEQRLISKLNEVNAEMWKRDRANTIDYLEKTGLWAQMDGFHRSIALRTSLAAAELDFMKIIEAEPSLLAQPQRTQKIHLRILIGAAISDAETTGALDPFPNIIRNSHDLARFRQSINNLAQRHLADPRARALHLRFCAAWKRGSSADRQFEICQTHIFREGAPYLSDGPVVDRHMYSANDYNKSTEERIYALHDAFKAICERFYKHLLMALYRLERGQDDLAKVPNTVGALTSQLGSHPAWRDSDVLLSLVDPEISIIRNATAHEDVHFQADGRVVFVNKSKKREQSTPPLNAAQLQQKVNDLLNTSGIIAKSFNYLQPPLSLSQFPKHPRLFVIQPSSTLTC